jgi:hypothetical protein
MLRLRTNVSLLVVLLALSFGTGQFLPDSTTPLGSIWAFYAFLGVLTAAVLRSNAITRMPPVVLGTAIVALFILVPANPWLGAETWSSGSVALAIVTVLAAVLAVTVAQRMTEQLDEFEDAIANITLGDLARVKTLEAADEDIIVEMARARRHERPLTVTVLEVDPTEAEAPLHRIVHEVQQAMMQRYMMSGLARLAAQTTRRGDIVVQDATNNRVIILSPEASPAQIERLADRLQLTAQQRLGLSVRCGFAGFPHNALTFSDLVQRAAESAAEHTAEIVHQEPSISRRVRQGWVAAAAPVGTASDLDERVEETVTLHTVDANLQATASTD